MFRGSSRLLAIKSHLQRAHYTSGETPSVHFQKQQSVRKIILDRPKALNALNLEMIYNITPQLQAWQDSDLCKVIVMTAQKGAKAFCAGGDVKNVVLAAQSDDVEAKAAALKFFEEEYKMNHLIATTKKPFLSILDGITMGGGVGLSVHGHFRIVTEKTMFAMPETAIGLFPDVGGSFFLPRLDGYLGTFLGLTGQRVKGEEAFFAGFGTHFVPSSRLDALIAQLAELETDELDVINNCIDSFSGSFTAEQFKNWSYGGENGEIINRCFKFDTIEEIFEALSAEKSDFAQKQLSILKTVSPTSLKVTLEQLRRGAKLDIASCLKMEFNMVQQFLETPDFLEGVTAKLIEKREAIWNPSIESLSSISKSEIEKLFFAKKERSLNLYNRFSYHDYPHRTLSGLPTDRDVLRVVMGEGRRNAVTVKPQTKKEALEWIMHNWGRYDSGAIGELNIPTQLALDGGFGRGKVGMEQKVQCILDSKTTETPNGLVWN